MKLKTGGGLCLSLTARSAAHVQRMVFFGGLEPPVIEQVAILFAMENVANLELIGLIWVDLAIESDLQ